MLTPEPIPAEKRGEAYGLRKWKGPPVLAGSSEPVVLHLWGGLSGSADGTQPGDRLLSVSGVT